MYFLFVLHSHFKRVMIIFSMNGMCCLSPEGIVAFYVRFSYKSESMGRKAIPFDGL